MGSAAVGPPGSLDRSVRRFHPAKDTEKKGPSSGLLATLFTKKLFDGSVYAINNDNFSILAPHFANTFVDSKCSKKY